MIKENASTTACQEGFACQNYDAFEESQLSVKLNDALVIVNDLDPEWWLAKCLRTGKCGFLPAEIVQSPDERMAKINLEKNKKVLNDEKLNSHRTFRFFQRLLLRNEVKKSVQFYETVLVKETNFYDEQEEQEGQDEKEEQNEKDKQEEKDERKTPFEKLDFFSLQSIDGKSINGIMDPKKEKWQFLQWIKLRLLGKPCDHAIKMNQAFFIRVYAGNFAESSYYKTIMIPGTLKINELIKIIKEKFRLCDRYEYQITAVNDTLLTSVTLGQTLSISETIQKLRSMSTDVQSRRMSFWKSSSFNQLNFIAKEAESLFASESDLSGRGKTELEALTQCRFILNRNVSNSNYGIVPFYINVECEAHQPISKSGVRLAVNAALSIREVIDSSRRLAGAIEKIGTKSFLMLSLPGKKEEILLPDSDSLLIVLARYSEYDPSLLRFKCKEQINFDTFKPILHISLSTSEFDPFNELQYGGKFNNGHRISWDSHLLATD